jgi:hypothetical protein
MKLLASLFALLLLAGCSSSEESVLRNSPFDCEIEGVISAFAAEVPGSDYIPTDWEPAAGTDLDAIYDAGGIACSYGIGEAEVGGTVMWANIDPDTWTERSIQWTSSGFTPIDLAGFDESAAFILKEGTSADEMHLWAINLLIDGVWIHIGATFLQDLQEANGIIAAAIEATEL